MDENTLAAGAIGAFLTVLFQRGWPVLKEYLGWQTEREKTIAAAAREGPEMLNARLVADLGEQKQLVGTLASKIDTLQRQHQDCEVKHAQLLAKVEYQEFKIVELQIELDAINDRAGE